MSLACSYDVNSGSHRANAVLTPPPPLPPPSTAAITLQAPSDHAFQRASELPAAVHPGIQHRDWHFRYHKAVSSLSRLEQNRASNLISVHISAIHSLMPGY